MNFGRKASQLVKPGRAIPILADPRYACERGPAWRAKAGTAHGFFPEPLGLQRLVDSPSPDPGLAAREGTEGAAKHNQAVRAGPRDIMEDWGISGRPIQHFFVRDSRDGARRTGKPMVMIPFSRKNGGSVR